MGLVFVSLVSCSCRPWRGSHPLVGTEWFLKMLKWPITRSQNESTWLSLQKTLWLPIALRFQNKLLSKVCPTPTASHTLSVWPPYSPSNMPSSLLPQDLCTSCLLLEELFLQTLACLVPSCPLNLNPDVIFDHWFKVPSTPLVIVYLITLVYFLQSTWHYQKMIWCVYLLTYYPSPPPWNVRDQGPCCIPSTRTVPGILQA